MLFFILITGWIASAFFCASVANEKGYSGTAWGFAGFLFGFFALIAVAGLPDKKLRKYIRQIGEKQKAIEKESEGAEWVEQPSDWGSSIRFVMPPSATEEEMYKRLISEISKNKELKKKFDKLKIKSYEFNEPLLGGKEFSLMGEDLRTLFVMSAKKLNDIQIQWAGEF